MSVSAAQTTFWVFAALMGISLSSIFLVYTGARIVQTFFITAASFGALSLYGYTTKRDLTGMGTFLFMGLIGLIIAIGREHLPAVVANDAVS
jgi:FtsH-binding integral membrane protein